MECAVPAGRGSVTLPWGLIATLGLVFAVELAVAKLEEEWQTIVFAVYSFTNHALEVGAAKTDVLVVGDSLLKFGVLPRIIEQRIGQRSYNLAQIGGHPPDTYFVVRRALARGAKPSLVVLDFKANTVQFSPLNRPSESVELRTVADCLDLAWVFKDASYFAAQMMAKVFPSVKFRQSIRSGTLAALSGRQRQENDVRKVAFRNWTVNLGAHVSPRDPAAKDRREHWDEKVYLVPQFACLPMNHVFVKRTLKLLAQHQIPVYWLIPPINPRVQKARERLGVDAAFAKYVRSFLARYPNLTVVDGRHAGYDAAQFVDAAHLDRHGAYVFSIALADVLARGSGDTRWVELPRYREPVFIPPLEDVAQSRTALVARSGSAVMR